jgi:large subunit ribosomal protein L23
MQVIKKPVLTEKSIDLYKNFEKVTFEVDENATKKQAKEMLEKVFDVEVSKVWVINRLGTSKINRFTGKRKSKRNKKIMVFKLEKGKIDLFKE